MRRVVSPGFTSMGKLYFLPSTTKVTRCLPGLSESLDSGAMGVLLPVSRPSMSTLAHGCVLATRKPGSLGLTGGAAGAAAGVAAGEAAPAAGLAAGAAAAAAGL